MALAEYDSSTARGTAQRLPIARDARVCLAEEKPRNGTFWARGLPPLPQQHTADPLFVGGAAVMLQINDIGRGKPAMSAGPGCRLGVAAALFLGQRQALPERFGRAWFGLRTHFSFWGSAP